MSVDFARRFQVSPVVWSVCLLLAADVKPCCAYLASLSRRRAARISSGVPDFPSTPSSSSGVSTQRHGTRTGACTRLIGSTAQSSSPLSIPPSTAPASSLSTSACRPHPPAILTSTAPRTRTHPSDPGTDSPHHNRHPLVTITVVPQLVTNSGSCSVRCADRSFVTIAACCRDVFFCCDAMVLY